MIDLIPHIVFGCLATVVIGLTLLFVVCVVGLLLSLFRSSK